MKKSLSARLNKHLTAASALAAAAAAGLPSSAQAAIVYSGPVNINIPSTTAGVYLNVVTGVNNVAPGSVPGWDLNPWSSSSLEIWGQNSADPVGTNGVLDNFTGGTAASVDNIPAGTVIDGTWTYGMTDSTVETTGPSAFVLNSSSNLVGFRFYNEATLQVHYGWMRVSLSATLVGQPRAIVEYAYEDTPGQGIMAGATTSDPSAGACCKPDGTCATLNPSDCSAAGGTFTSAGTPCASAGCATRCCMNDSTCQMLSPSACTSAGGVSTANSSCAVACPAPGACCMGDGTCTVILQANCASAGGNFGGFGSTCAQSCGVSSINENFDAVAAGSLPPGWGTSGTGAGTVWTTVNTFANSGPNSAFASDVGSTSAQVLQLPTVLATGPLTIDFRTRLLTESGFDGLIVQASTNGGAYANIGQSAWRGATYLDHYNAHITSTSNTFTAQRYFSGTYTDWTRRVASIPANNGDYVALRLVMSSDGSVAATGVWVDDVVVTSAATGACCAADGTCSMQTVTACTGAGGVFNSAASCATAVCAKVAYPEVEPNETRPTATVVNFANPGDYIQGNTTGTSATAGAASLDQFLVKTPAMAAGIYRNRIVLTTTGAEGHVGTIRGLTQTAATAGPWEPSHLVGTATTTDATIQTSSTTNSSGPRTNQWYGFGKQEQIYYRVTGTTTTIADYKATWTSAPVTPVDIGSFQPGAITISTVGQGHTTDTDLWVYDSNFNAIDGFGNDGSSTNGGAPANASAPSWLTRTYPAGVYYMALANTNIANNKGSPSDDNFRTGAMLDFGDALANSSAGTALNVAFAVTDSAATTQFAATRPGGAFEILWYKFTVGSACYANCDNSTQPPVLNVQDFSCFLTKYAAGDSYANCDNSTQPPILNVQDFSCFLSKYAAGCP